jgi:hypothetical protein
MGNEHSNLPHGEHLVDKFNEYLIEFENVSYTEEDFKLNLRMAELAWPIIDFSGCAIKYLKAAIKLHQYMQMTSTLRSCSEDRIKEYNKMVVERMLSKHHSIIKDVNKRLDLMFEANDIYIQVPINWWNGTTFESFDLAQLHQQVLLVDMLDPVSEFRITVQNQFNLSHLLSYLQLPRNRKHLEKKVHFIYVLEMEGNSNIQFLKTISYKVAQTKSNEYYMTFQFYSAENRQAFISWMRSKHQPFSRILNKDTVVNNLNTLLRERIKAENKDKKAHAVPDESNTLLSREEFLKEYDGLSNLDYDDYLKHELNIK